MQILSSARFLQSVFEYSSRTFCKRSSVLSSVDRSQPWGAISIPSMAYRHRQSGCSHGGSIFLTCGFICNKPAIASKCTTRPPASSHKYALQMVELFFLVHKWNLSAQELKSDGHLPKGLKHQEQSYPHRESGAGSSSLNMWPVLDGTDLELKLSSGDGWRGIEKSAYNGIKCCCVAACTGGCRQHGEAVSWSAGSVMTHERSMQLVMRQAVYALLVQQRLVIMKYYSRITVVS